MLPSRRTGMPIQFKTVSAAADAKICNRQRNARVDNRRNRKQKQHQQKRECQRLSAPACLPETAPRRSRKPETRFARQTPAPPAFREASVPRPTPRSRSPHQFGSGRIASQLPTRLRQTTNATTGSTKNPCDISGSVAHCRAKPASNGRIAGNQQDGGNLGCSSHGLECNSESLPFLRLTHSRG